jgi:hypothetical protein
METQTVQSKSPQFIHNDSLLKQRKFSLEWRDCLDVLRNTPGDFVDSIAACRTSLDILFAVHPQMRAANDVLQAVGGTVLFPDNPDPDDPDNKDEDGNGTHPRDDLDGKNGARSRAWAPNQENSTRAGFSQVCGIIGVRKRGLEPPRDCSHRNLNPARLPVPPLSR